MTVFDEERPTDATHAMDGLFYKEDEEGIWLVYMGDDEWEASDSLYNGERTLSQLKPIR